MEEAGSAIGMLTKYHQLPYTVLSGMSKTLRCSSTSASVITVVAVK